MQLEEARRALRTIDVEAAMGCQKQSNMLRVVKLREESRKQWQKWRGDYSESEWRQKLVRKLE